jgi:hypothetical protein
VARMAKPRRAEDDDAAISGTGDNVPLIFVKC